MKRIGRLGVWVAVDFLNKKQVVELVQGVERLKFDTFWYPEAFGYESLVFGGFALSQTSRLNVASGIANIYARDATASAAGHDSLNNLYDNRFILGLGVSHLPMVQGFRGHDYGKPVTAMRSYLDAMERAELLIAKPERNVVLAALGPKMTALAGERTRGAHSYLVTPEHTARSRATLGPDKWLCVEQKICLTTDAAAARAAAAQVLELYLPWPNYTNNWLSLGFTPEDFKGRGSERLLDSMVIWGSAKEIRARLQAHFDAGASHVCVQPLNPDGSRFVDWRALEAVAGL